MPEENKKSLPGLKEKRYQQKKDIIGYLYKMERLSKPQICRFTNMTTPTISRIIDELIAEGWVSDLGQGASIGGKRPHIFSLNPDAAYMMGVDIGREQMKIAIFNLQKKVIGDIKIFPSILETNEKEDVLCDLKKRIDQTLVSLGIPAAKIKVAGFALPGLLDSDGNSYSYLTFENTNIQQVLENMLHIPIFIDNDSSIIAMGEHAFGVAQGAEHALCVSISECIGLGMILNSQPYTGCKGMAGEFGHIRISGLEALCYCGKAGCLETVASGRAIVKAAENAIAKGRATSISKFAKGPITLESVIEASRHDDIFAIELLQKAGEKTGEGLSTLIHLFNPELIVIGGEITGAGELITASIRQAIDKYAFTRMKNQCEIKLSHLNDQACIYGTLALVMKQLYYDSNSSYSLY
ncbi:MAG: ROK family transcriptional regulator [Odoribacter sp.]